MGCQPPRLPYAGSDDLIVSADTADTDGSPSSSESLYSEMIEALAGLGIILDGDISDPTNYLETAY